MELTTENLLKLTVPQLKALCKEHHISGYSKLSKPLLVQKISTLKGPTSDSNARRLSGAGTIAVLGLDGTTAQPSSSNTRVLLSQASLRQETSAAGNTPNSPHISSSTPTRVPKGAPVPRLEARNRMAPLDLDHSQVLNSQNEDARVNASGAHGSDQRIGQTSIHGLSTQGTKRQAASKVSTSRKRSKPINDVPGPSSNCLTEVCNTQSTKNQAFPSPPLSANISLGTLSKLGKKQNIPQGGSAVTNLPKEPKSRLIPRTSVGLSLLKPSASPVNRRFKPIVVQKRPPPPHSGYLKPQSSMSTSKSETALRYLDIDPTVVAIPCLLPIRLPPKLSQRKKVTVYALIFTYLDTGSLNHCARASRVLRYAAYLSAYHKLSRDFAGTRLTTLTRKYSPSTTNMWPYIRARLAESTERKTRYQRSFLAKVVSDHSIAENVWLSLDHVDQATVSMRFVLTKLWFWLSLGGNLQNASWSHGSVTDAQEVIPGEVWKVTVSSSLHTENFYILAATCEVIGRVPSAAPMSASFATVRADWSQWIQEHLASANHRSLSDNLTWPNHEEYDKGISRLWLRNTEREGAIGRMKRIVARRYVIASLMANSVSGRWMSSSDMSHEFNGYLSTGYDPQPSHGNRARAIHLFLPLHHHIESVHFATSKGVPLHAALATVQTPHREYYILKDTGMQVGCEEDGVSPVWADLVGCTVQGVLSGPSPC